MAGKFAGKGATVTGLASDPTVAAMSASRSSRYATLPEGDTMVLPLTSTTSGQPGGSWVFGGRPAEAARVPRCGEPDVRPTEIPHRLGGQGLDLLLVARIAFKIGPVKVSADNACALLPEEFDCCLADPRSGTGDHRDLSGQASPQCPHPIVPPPAAIIFWPVI